MGASALSFALQEHTRSLAGTIDEGVGELLQQRTIHGGSTRKVHAKGIECG